MATKKDLIPFCRYYKGEEKRPKDAPLVWGYEARWVEMSENIQEGSASFYTLGEYLDNYLRAGLREFEQFDKIPVTLKSLLFDRFTHFGGDAESFKRWYINEYKEGED